MLLMFSSFIKSVLCGNIFKRQSCLFWFPDPNINSFISTVFFYVQVKDKRKESGVNLNSAELLVLRNAAFHSACYFRQLFGTLGSNYLFSFMVSLKLQSRTQC